MKRYYFILLLLCVQILAIADNGMSDSPAVGKKAWYSMLTETRFSKTLHKNTSQLSLDWSIAPGCSFRKGWAVRVPIEFTTMMFPTETPAGTYNMTGTIGLNVSYNVLSSDNYRLELDASGGSTFLKTSCNYAYADLSIKFGRILGKATPFVTMGCRYHIYYSGNLASMPCIYLGLGIWVF